MKPLRVFGISAAVFLLDQLTKAYIHNTMHLYQSYPVLGDFLRITYIENSGMAFGIKVSSSLPVTLAAMVAAAVIMVYLYKMNGEQRTARAAMALILGGALGNLYDRITRGSVVDFIDVEFFNLRIPEFNLLFLRFPGYSLERWPVFNVADAAVTVGMIILAVIVLTEKKPEAPSQAVSA